MADEKIDQKRPAEAESELKKMQQRLVDDTVDDSFPASDPPAWTTTGSKSVAARCHVEAKGDASGDSAEETYGQAEDMVRRVADQASDFAKGAYRRGEKYLEEGRRRFPEAERYYREGHRAVSQRIDAYPLTAVIIAGAVGYGLAWLIHGPSSSDRSMRRHSSPYGRRLGNEAYRQDMNRREHAARAVG
jgi:ElaB/YqjD/DUF883 family membrane-anchored ribosome-binding protein